MTDRQIEMHWYCGTCHHDNRGRDLECAQCGKPRENEEYLMPSDTRSAPSVTEVDLLKKATAGPNWTCKYCRSSRRRTDGKCARCGAPSADSQQALCGAESTPVPGPTARTVPPDLEEDVFEKIRQRRRPVAIALGCLLLCLIGSVCWWGLAPHEAHVVVSAVHWRHSISIERYHVVGEEGWVPASDALDARDEGPRIHHYDHRAVGSHIESYSETVACGQTCTAVPRSCSESCSSNKNGFATCRTSCTGGGQSCSTRYCSETRHRTVTDYQDFPVFQDWYTWRAWRWTHQRDIPIEGRDALPRWPTPSEEHLGEGLSDRENEREGARTAEYSVTYARGDERWTVTPKAEGEFRKRKPGSRWQISVNRLGMVSEERIEP